MIDLVRKREIEARLTSDLAQNHILPAAIGYQSRLTENVLGIKDILSAAESKEATKTQVELIREISAGINTIRTNSEKMRVEREKAAKMDLEKQA